MITKTTKLSSSFRDPSGFVFQKNGELFRQVNPFCQENYNLLMESGLYKTLTDNGLLIPHEETKNSLPNPSAYKIIKPEPVPFISYPYEWCFGQLKDAALLTLAIQKISLSFGLSLKDASSFNIQFLKGKPILIDTLSFEKYSQGTPWVAYRQFCEQFLAPLSLMAEKDLWLAKLLPAFLGSIPLDLAAKILPLQSKLHPSTFLHLVLHAKSQKKYANTLITQKENLGEFNKQSLLALIDNLESAVQRLSVHPQKTVWTSYYDPPDQPSYNQQSFTQKKKSVAQFLAFLKPKTVWDLGANTGIFSQIAAQQKAFVIAIDNDPWVVELNYQQIKTSGIANILPLWTDITNPSPAIGWANQEWPAFLTRPHPDVVLALALVHHLAIANNLPLPRLAEFFAQLGPFLIIEFVPKEDSQTQRLLANREDIFPNYTITAFEQIFQKFFTIKAVRKLSGSVRVLYLMERKNK